MAFPSTQVSTANLDSAADNPSLARVDLLAAVQNLNTIISGANAALGVALLDANGEIASQRLPSTYSPQNNLTLSPSTAVVKIEDVLRLQPLNTEQVQALTDSVDGDMVYVTDGRAGDPCLAVRAGSQWNVIPFNSGTISKDTQAALVATVEMICIPEE